MKSSASARNKAEFSMESETHVHPTLSHAKSHLQTSFTDLNDDFKAGGDES